MKKRRKGDDNLVPHKENIVEQQKKLHHVKVECNTKVHNMAEKVKALEKHLEIVSQINLKMESLETKIDKLDIWRNMEKCVPSGLPTVKYYVVMLHTLATNECQELDSKFEERARHILVGMMDVYDKSVQDVQKYLQWPEINF
jgi:hypothetical protein